MSKRILLVEPEFPIPKKSKNHGNFLPIGLLKIATYLTENGCSVKLLRGIPLTSDALEQVKRFDAQEIWVTSLFTYWASYVRDAVQFYRQLFPHAKTTVGGIYASLFTKEEVAAYTGCDEVHQGVVPEAEKCVPSYELINNADSHPIDYQIIHTSRGCSRGCSFCGTWKIEPEFVAKASIADEVKCRKLIFYDNNLLMNPHIENILAELQELKRKKKILWCESQSGFDGRMLLGKPQLGRMIKGAGFRYPRIAWDMGYESFKSIKEEIDILTQAGYTSRDQIYIFVLSNWDVPFDEMEQKRLKCWEWKVQISDCRYRPLKQLHDRYDGRTSQTDKDYYVHVEAGWTDALIKQFRKNVRHQNICLRQSVPLYSKFLEHKKADDQIAKEIKAKKNLDERIKLLSSLGIDYWVPDKVRYPE
jgi:hypothetical protein